MRAAIIFAAMLFMTSQSFAACKDQKLFMIYSGTNGNYQLNVDGKVFNLIWVAKQNSFKFGMNGAIPVEFLIDSAYQNGLPSWPVGVRLEQCKQKMIRLDSGETDSPAIPLVQKDEQPLEWSRN